MGRPQASSKTQPRSAAKAKRQRDIGRKGGLASARSRTLAQRRQDSSKGGVICYLTHGAKHYQDMQKKWWASLTEEQKEARREFMRELNRKRWKKK